LLWRLAPNSLVGKSVQRQFAPGFSVPPDAVRDMRRMTYTVHVRMRHNPAVRPADLERLYDDQAPAMLGFLTYRTGDRTLAEDLLSDVFERVLRAHRRFDRRKGTEKAWLYAIALNILHDHFRRSGAERRALDRESLNLSIQSDADSRLDRIDDREIVAKAMDVLTVHERDVVALRYGADLRVADIARTIGEPVTTVEGRLVRALRKLRAELVTTRC